MIGSSKKSGVPPVIALPGVRPGQDDFDGLFFMHDLTVAEAHLRMDEIHRKFGYRYCGRKTDEIGVVLHFSVVDDYEVCVDRDIAILMNCL